MYEKFYGLREQAFNLTPDPAFLFLNKRSKDALDTILYGIQRREGFALIVGDVGTGKTTLCWALLDRLGKRDIRTALVQNPLLSEINILKAIIQDLGVRPPNASKDGPLDVFDTSWMRGMDKRQLIDLLNIFLAQRAEENVFTVLIIDEAQNLSPALLEQLRLLSNLETAKKKLLQIIFVGQLELDKKLRLPELRQLNQRISVRFENKTLSMQDTENYIRHRLAMAGGSRTLRFAAGAFKSIWHYSKGYPRLINLICDRALLAGYKERSMVINKRLVRMAVNSLEGREEAGFSLSSGWLKRIVPFLVPVILLLALIPATVRLDWAR